MSPWKVILATMVIFGCGVITGGLLIKTQLPLPSAPEPARVSLSTNAPPPWAQIQRMEFLRRIDKQLQLTPAREHANRLTQIIKEIGLHIPRVQQHLLVTDTCVSVSACDRLKNDIHLHLHG